MWRIRQLPNLDPRVVQTVRAPVREAILVTFEKIYIGGGGVLCAHSTSPPCVLGCVCAPSLACACHHQLVVIDCDCRRGSWQAGLWVWQVSAKLGSAPPVAAGPSPCQTGANSSPSGLPPAPKAATVSLCVFTGSRVCSPRVQRQREATDMN